MTQQDKPYKQKPPIIGSNDIDADADLGYSISQEFGKYSARKAQLASEKGKADTQSVPQKHQAIVGSNDIDADADLGDSIAQEFGRYSARKEKRVVETAEQEEKPLSTDLEGDQTRTDINVGTSE